MVTKEKPAVRDAATVMLLRDGTDGLEVFMVRRAQDSSFVGGAYVFPGGAVDERDRTADVEKVCAGRTDREASSRMGVPSGGLAYWVAAIRECFEEAGFLLAYDEKDQMVSLNGAGGADGIVARRQSLSDGSDSLIALCREEGIRLAADRLHYFSHWIAPLGVPKRFSTRFFVAAAPPGQEPIHDNRETVAHVWLRPAEALERHHRGEFFMVLPTVKHLEALCGYHSVADVLAVAALHRNVPTIQPVRIEDEEGMKILIPGDPGYEAAWMEASQ